MPTTNAQNKKRIDDALAHYAAKMAELEQKRNNIVSNFLNTHNEKRLAELREQLKIT